MNRYSSYLSSGVEWIGDIPAHWDVARTQFVARLESGHTPSRDKDEYWVDCEIPWFGLSDVWQIRDGRTTYVTDTKEKISALGLANSSARLLPRGTVILSRTASVGFSAIMGTDMATTQDFVNWVCGSKIQPEFLLYVFRAMQPEFRRLTMGSTHQTIYMPDVRKFTTPLPPTPEQRTIATFLDRETAKIDTLIEKKQRLIELLQEKRTALITQAVTKGLDPSVEMKDSGVEWLGEVPKGWDVVLLKYVATLQMGLTLGKEYEKGDLETRPYLRVANVQAGYLDLEEVTEIQVPRTLVDRYELEPGDVLMTEGGDFDKLGRGCVWQGQVRGCLHQNHIFAVRPQRSSLRPEFLSAVLESGYGRAYFTATAKQSTNLASTNSTKVRNFPLPLPNITVQGEILETLWRALSRLGDLMVKMELAISRLQEYRTALVSAAVTGKIDVREAA